MSRRSSSFSGQFAGRLVEMLESYAYRTLSLSALRLINRIEIELAHHGGHDNGRLPVTFDDFEHYGIHRHAIAPAMREAEALGFIEVTVRGRAGSANRRSPNLFRLTFRPVKGARNDGTHEWRQIKSAEEAEALARAARLAKAESLRAENAKSDPRKPHHNSIAYSAEIVTTGVSTETTTTNYISGRGRSVA
ncbi:MULTISPECIES: hypothetical protein [Bradyrhizobium]|uniref:Uncharacterized protein n=1 Tax=Bradyrhizobium rifense TaxID=515499 RepID=A0A5D3KGQ4_9BRAD|nr:hypothetical protein [Bradyrhizobium rifense]TYL95944.1 hypothetical protein FXB40_13600 [Bradyrhizobium rifense]